MLKTVYQQLLLSVCPNGLFVECNCNMSGAGLSVIETPAVFNLFL